MLHAARAIPHFTFVAECDMSAVVAARAAAKARTEARGVKLTYVAYIVRALVPALVKFPFLNASLDDARGEIVLKRHYDIGIATATDEGLTVPVVHHADRLGLFDLAQEIDRLATAARTRKLALTDLAGATFTVTTTGALGGLLATPIIHHPQVAILGVHEIKPRPVVRDGKIVAREMTNLSLSLDHRVVDGQVGAEFLYEVIKNLEDPSRVPLEEAGS
jgi:pyruvate dehydrogenase E2 component (dihydrolipoamide acetyltransferase)